MDLSDYYLIDPKVDSSLRSSFTRPVEVIRADLIVKQITKLRVESCLKLISVDDPNRFKIWRWKNYAHYRKYLIPLGEVYFEWKGLKIKIVEVFSEPLDGIYNFRCINYCTAERFKYNRSWECLQTVNRYWWKGKRHDLR